MHPSHATPAAHTHPLGIEGLTLPPTSLDRQYTLLLHFPYYRKNNARSLEPDIPTSSCTYCTSSCLLLSFLLSHYSWYIARDGWLPKFNNVAFATQNILHIYTCYPRLTTFTCAYTRHTLALIYLTQIFINQLLIVVHALTNPCM